MSTIENTLVTHDRTTPTLQRVRRELRGLHDDAERAGRAIDRMAGVDGVARLEAMATGGRDAGRGVTDMAEAMRRGRPTFDAHERQLARMTRETRGLRGETDKLTASLTRLNGVRAVAHVDVRGTAEALAEVRALQAELAAVGRRNATATVGARTMPMAGGGGFGGGGRGFGWRGIGAGPLLAAGAVALPAGQALIGGGGALAGSALFGAAGAGAVYGGGLLTLAAGLGAFTAVARPAEKQLENGIKLTEQWTEAVRQYGNGSREAKAAKDELDRSVANQPGLRQAIRELRAFNREHAAATAAGRGQFFGMRADVARAGRRAMPGISSAENRAAFAMRDALGSQLDLATSTESMGALRMFTDAFVRDLPTAERSLQNIEKTVVRIAVGALPFVHDLNVAIEEGTGRWEQWSRSEERVSRDLGGLVDHTERWVDLLGDSAELIAHIAGAGAPAGGSMVDRLDSTIERWDRWIVDNPRTVERWFDNAADGAVRIADAMGDVVHYLDQTATALGPVLDGFTGLVSLATSLGVVGTPGAGALLFGAYSGLRGRGGRGGPGGAGGAGGLGGAGAGVAAGLSGSALASQVRNTYRMNRTGGFVAGPGGVERVAPAGRAASARAALGMGGSAAAPALGGAAGLAARRFLPVAAGLGALEAYGFDGDLLDRLQVFGSSMTLGAIARPTDRAARGDRAAQITDGFVQRNVLNRDASIAGSQDAISALEREIARLQGVRARGTAGGIANALTNVSSLGTDWGMTEADKQKAWGASKESVRLNRERVKLLQQEAEALRKGQKEMRAEEARRSGSRFASSIGGIYNTYAAQHGDMRGAAMTRRDVQERLRWAGGSNAEMIGESALQWAESIAKENPAMQKEVDRITRSIRARFRQLGVDIQIVNGDILTGSTREWQSIGAAITDPIERAAQRAKEGFTAIQEQAIGSLVAMGYSRSSAKQFVREVQKGTVSAADPEKTMGPAAFNQRSLSGKLGAQLDHSGRKKGTGDGHGYSGHGARRSGGGGSPALMGANPGLAMYASVGAQYGLRVSSGLRKGAITSSGNRSMHADGNAIDLAGAPDDRLRAARALASQYGSGLDELIYTPLGFGIKNGKRVPLSFWGPEINKAHTDHVHVADTTPSGGPAMAFSPDTAGPGLQMIALDRPKSGVAGVAGMLADAATGAYASALEAALNQGAGGGASGKLSFDQVARLAESVGLPGITFAQIAKGESGFDPRAVGHDPGGTQGLGLWQITTRFNDDIIKQFGGREAMFDPRTNALAAKAIYDRQGVKAWYGTKYVTDYNAHYQGDGTGYEARQPVKPVMSSAVSRGASRGGGVVMPLSVHVSGTSAARVRAVVEPMLSDFADRVASRLDEMPLENEQELMA